MEKMIKEEIQKVVMAVAHVTILGDKIAIRYVRFGETVMIDSFQIPRLTSVKERTIAKIVAQVAIERFRKKLLKSYFRS